MNILIVKTSSIGDIIQAFPVVDYLKNRFPDAVIDWVVEYDYRGLVESHPQIDRAILFGSRAWRKKIVSSGRDIGRFVKELRQKRYDLLFDLQGNTKSSFITALARAEEKVGLGWRSVPELPNFFTTGKHIEVSEESQIQQRYLSIVQNYFHDEVLWTPRPFSLTTTDEEAGQLHHWISGPKRRVMIACHSRWTNKTVPLERIDELMETMAEETPTIFYMVCGSKEERSQYEGLDVPGERFIVEKPTFPLWQALIREMDLVVAVDSAALALCGTTSTPSISFFGPSLATVYKPLGDHHRAWQGGCPYNKQFKTRCPLLRSCTTGACLKSVSKESVVRLYRSLGE